MKLEQLNEFNLFKKSPSETLQYTVSNHIVKFKMYNLSISIVYLTSIDVKGPDKSNVNKFKINVIASVWKESFIGDSLESTLNSAIDFVNDHIKTAKAGKTETRPADIKPLSLKNFDIKKILNDIK